MSELTEMLHCVLNVPNLDAYGTIVCNIAKYQVGE